MLSWVFLVPLSEGTRWLSEKIVQCGKTIGVMVDCCPGGRNDVVKYVVAKEKQNRDDFLSSKPKKKGVRELHNLSSSINYEKSKEGK